MPPRLFDFVLIGAGRVGSAVAASLQIAGHRLVGAWSRSEGSIRSACELLRCDPVDIGAPPPCDVALIGVTDGAIGSVAGRLAESARQPLIGWHLAGSSGIGPLSALVEAGGGACALHPVQACPDVATAIRRLPGSAWGITCSAGLEAWACDVIARDLRGRPVWVDEDHRSIWHAAAVMTSNGSAAVMAAGERLLRSIGIDSPTSVLGPLASGTVQNAIEGGGGAATLTGPVVRGDLDIVRVHLDALARLPAGRLDAYLRIAGLIAGVARDAGRIDDHMVKRMVADLGLDVAGPLLQDGDADS